MAQLDWGQLVGEAEEQKAYQLLPDGDYDFTVASAETKSTKTGKTMFSLKAQVATGPSKGQIVFENLVISPESAKALGMVFVKFAALGLPRAYFEQNSPSNEQIEAALIGRSFRGKVGSRTWQGEKYNEIQKYYPATAGLVPGVPMPVNASTPPPPPPPPASSGAAGAPADPALVITTPVAAAPLQASVPPSPF